MSKPKYVRIKLHGGSSYVQPVKLLADALDGELDGVEAGQSITITFTPLDMADERWEQLPDFEGH